MPGAGGYLAANHIYNLSARDGLEIGLFSASTAMEPLMGNDQAKFDAAKFGWIGSMNQDISFCGVWQGPGVATSFQDILKKDSRELIFGSAGPAAGAESNLRLAYSFCAVSSFNGTRGAPRGRGRSSKPLPGYKTLK
jgi:hypothetical protein